MPLGLSIERHIAAHQRAERDSQLRHGRRRPLHVDRDRHRRIRGFVQRRGQVELESGKIGGDAATSARAPARAPCATRRASRSGRRSQRRPAARAPCAALRRRACREIPAECAWPRGCAARVPSSGKVRPEAPAQVGMDDLRPVDIGVAGQIGRRERRAAAIQGRVSRSTCTSTRRGSNCLNGKNRSTPALRSPVASTLEKPRSAIASSGVGARDSRARPRHRRGRPRESPSRRS